VNITTTAVCANKQQSYWEKMRLKAALWILTELQLSTITAAMMLLEDGEPKEPIIKRLTRVK